ncbi:acyltransferase [Kitasatospora sp. GP82]|uniref:acyltransferase family protein n=1 Tax=Kitasatospora sp. GP82 TaxID=3035089 RepID=UPI0024762AE3|nr:acyltransferase [Kitasatospora sp. GP82]MDH6125452.1 surface polysaccharide O-acyltransferase-like enzyme [Kitasatospora sp. GP82]
MGRNRHADLLRVGAIGAVVTGHWLVTDVSYRGGRLSGLNALDYIAWGHWLTLLFQVMPVFFVVGGYANAVSWRAHRDLGGGWTDWVRRRTLRLVWPTTVYVAVAELMVTAASAAGRSAAELTRIGWFMALHLWFLPVYLVLVALTPALFAAHRRWGLAVPVAMALGAAGVDAAVLGPHLPLIGFTNYLLVWGSMHQWGFAWQDGRLTRRRWAPYALAGAGAALLAGLLVWSPFPADMIGTGERVGNTSPPSIALLAFAAVQAGLLLAAEPVGRRLTAPAARQRLLFRLNSAVMTVYLWHMVPVIFVAGILFPAGLLPQPRVGTTGWWALRPAWLAVLALVLIALTTAVVRAQRPLRRLPTGLGSPGRWSPVLLLCGLGAVIPALARLAIGGFAPAGHPPPLVLTCYAGGLLTVLLSGRPSPEHLVHR